MEGDQESEYSDREEDYHGGRGSGGGGGRTSSNRRRKSEDEESESEPQDDGDLDDERYPGGERSQKKAAKKTAKKTAQQIVDFYDNDIVYSPSKEDKEIRLARSENSSTANEDTDDVFYEKESKKKVEADRNKQCAMNVPKIMQQLLAEFEDRKSAVEIRGRVLQMRVYRHTAVSERWWVVDGFLLASAADSGTSSSILQMDGWNGFGTVAGSDDASNTMVTKSLEDGRRGSRL